MKIRSKLTYKFTLIVASLLLLFSLAIYLFNLRLRIERFDKRLHDKGMTTAKLFVKVLEENSHLLKIFDTHNYTKLANEKATIYDERGNELYTSSEMPAARVPDELKQLTDTEKIIHFNHGDDEAIGFIYQDKGKKYMVTVSAFDSFGWGKINYLRTILALLNIFSIILIFGASWFFSGEALKPISRIVNEVNTITAYSLNTRVNEGKGKDEMALLAITFNKMLERLESAFQTQKSFVANASHELRTPLTSIKAQLQVALLNEREKEQYKYIMDSVLQDVNSLIDLSNGLLRLAQAGFDISEFKLTRIRMDELIFTCISEVKKKYLYQTINLGLNHIPYDDNDLTISGNEALIKIAVVNVIDNACKYSHQRPVDIKLHVDTFGIRAEFSDQGEGIEAAELPHIFDAFYRGSNVRQFRGNGIGLPLTLRIVKLHKGTLEVKSEMNKGTQVIMFFPKI